MSPDETPVDGVGKSASCYGVELLLSLDPPAVTCLQQRECIQTVPVQWPEGPQPRVAYVACTHTFISSVLRSRI